MSTERPRFFVGSDHAGVALRGELCGVLERAGAEVVAVLGPATADTSVDYPDVAVELCRRVLAAPGAQGLLICGSGQGMAMTANKLPGIRAAVCGDAYSARMARIHNDANVLCLGQRVVGPGVAASVVEAFLGASFEGGRHAARVAKVDTAGG